MQQLALVSLLGSLVALGLLVQAQDQEVASVKLQKLTDQNVDNNINIISAEDYLELSLEDELKELSEELRTMQTECLDLKSQLEDSNGTGVWNAELQTQYNQCRLDLAEIEGDIQEVSSELVSSE